MKLFKIYIPVFLMIISFCFEAYSFSFFKRPWARLLHEAFRKDHYQEERKTEEQAQYGDSREAKQQYKKLQSKRAELDLSQVDNIIIERLDGRLLNDSYFDMHESFEGNPKKLSADNKDYLKKLKAVYLFPGRHVIEVRRIKDAGTDLPYYTQEDKISQSARLVEFFVQPEEKYVLGYSEDLKTWKTFVKKEDTEKDISVYYGYSQKKGFWGKREIVRASTDNLRYAELSHEHKSKLKRFWDVMNVYPGIAMTAFEQSLPAETRNDLSKKIKILSDVCENFSDEPVYYTLRGYYYFKAGHTYDALRDLDQSIDLDAAAKVSYVLRGEVRLASNDLQGAVRDFTRGMELDASDHRIYYARSIAYAHQGKFKHALGDVNVALALKKGDPHCRQLRVQIRDLIHWENFKIAREYAEGIDGEKNTEKAVKILISEAQHGNFYAQNYLNLVYTDHPVAGTAVQQAMKDYEAGMLNKVLSAELGSVLSENKNFIQDFSSDLSWFRKQEIRKSASVSQIR